MGKLLDRIVERFKPDAWRRLEVPEWGDEAVRDEAGEITTPAKPLVITYLPVTLEDQSFVAEAAKGDRHFMGAHLVARKACDEDHKRLFEQIDAVTLRTKADPVVVSRISTAMLGDLTLEQAVKN